MTHPAPLSEFAQGNTAIANINEAERMLSVANDIHEMLQLRDAAAAYELMANARGFKEAAQNAKIFQLAENVKPGNPQLFQDGINSKLPEGIDAHESHRWQLEASLPEEKFNDWIDESLARGWEISAGGLRRIAQNHAGKDAGDPRQRKLTALRGLADELMAALPAERRVYAEAALQNFMECVE